MISNSSSNTKNKDDVSKLDVQILFALRDCSFLSNAKISRILRKHQPSTSRELISLKNKKLVQQNSELEYSITEKGLEEINKKEYRTEFYEELQEHIKRLKEHPEPKGWTPKDLDLDGLTNAQCRLLYLFKHEEHLANAEIAKILNRHYPDTHDGLQFLLEKNLLEKNQDGEYNLTSKGHQQIKKNVSNNTICKLELQFVGQLKARPELRRSYVVIIAGLVSLGWIKSNPASATISSIPIFSATADPPAAATNSDSGLSLLSSGTKTKIIKILAIMGIVLGVTFAGTYVSAYLATEALLDKTDHWPGCIIQYMIIPEDAVSDLRFSSMNKVSNLESLKKEMHLAADVAHDSRNFQRSIEVSSTVLRLIDATDRTSLSQLAVAFRDIDHRDMDRLTCSETVHKLPQIKAKVFGKMALAEDKLLLGKYDESIDIISPVIDAYENKDVMSVEKPSYVNSLIIRGNAHLAMGNYDAAERDYILSIETGGEQADSLYGLGTVEFRRDGDFAQSEIYFGDAIEHDPTNSDIIGMYLRSLIFLEKYDQVKAEYHILLDEHPDIAKILIDENPKLKDIVHYDANRIRS